MRERNCKRGGERERRRKIKSEKWRERNWQGRDGERESMLRGEIKRQRKIDREKGREKERGSDKGEMERESAYVWG